MESPTAVAVFAQVLGPAVKLAEKGFEICAIDEQARGLLQMVQQVAAQLDDARLLRRQNSGRFTEFEKRMFNDTFRHGEDAIRQVASLAERPRVDMNAPGDQVSMNTRLVFVLRNSPSLNVSLTQLGIASQGLNRTILQLNSGNSRPSSSAGNPPIQSPREGERKILPTYEESQFLSSGRRRNMQRRATAMGLPNVAPTAHQPVQHVQPTLSDRSRSQSASTLYIPAVPSIPELMGDEAFQDRSHRSIPIIRVASAPRPSSDPIVIESEPIISTPAQSPSALSQSSSSPPRSPPTPRRFHSVSSNSSSDPGAPQSSIVTPPQSTGIQTPPNSWVPHFQEPRPPPANYVPIYPAQKPVVMPAPHHFSYPPYPSSAVPHTSVPDIPPQSTARNPWGQTVEEYRPSSVNLGHAPNQHQENRAPAANLPTITSQSYRQSPPKPASPPNMGIGIRNTQEPIPSRPAFTPYSPDFSPPLSPQVSAESEYVYQPSMARRGQGGRHRHHSLMESRARV